MYVHRDMIDRRFAGEKVPCVELFVVQYNKDIRLGMNVIILTLKIIEYSNNNRFVDTIRTRLQSNTWRRTSDVVDWHKHPTIRLIWHRQTWENGKLYRSV